MFHAGDHLTNPSLQGAMELVAVQRLLGLRWMDGQRGQEQGLQPDLTLGLAGLGFLRARFHPSPLSFLSVTIRTVRGVAPFPVFSRKVVSPLSFLRVCATSRFHPS